MNASLARAPFREFCRPGAKAFCIWCYPYAPPLADAPAQVFVGEWTGTDIGADIGVWQPDTGRWQVIGMDGCQITSHLFVDPYRPIVYLSGPKDLFEIDRRTLAVTPVAQIGRHYCGDVDPAGRLWMSLGRSLVCYDPRDGAVQRFADVSPDRYFYAEGTHMVLGAAPDGRIWTWQAPLSCLCVFDPATGKTKVVWAHDDDHGHKQQIAGTPVAVGNLIWAGSLCVDTRTDQVIAPPFPICLQAGDGGYGLLTRHTWHRTPSALLNTPRGTPVHRNQEVGYLDVASGRFEKIGSVPAEHPLGPAGTSAMGSWTLHEPATLLSADKHQLLRVDLKQSRATPVALGFEPLHPQCMFSWTVGPDHNVYASGMSHDLWRADPQGNVANLGDVVNVRGGELWGFANFGQKLFIISYTGSVLTRVDVSRPLDHWGKDEQDNPRHIIDLAATGQHRPRGIDITPQGHLYYGNCADYCLRREGALVIVDAASEQVLKIVDPLLPGEQIWAVCASTTRPEVYVGTSEGSFVVWDTQKMQIIRRFLFPPRAGDGAMTSAMIKTGGVRFLAAAGDRVVGNRFGGLFDCFIYHADTGEMDGPRPHELGRLFGVFPRQTRPSVLLRFNGSLYEMDAAGKIELIFPEPLPGFHVVEGPDGRLYMGDGVTVYAQ